MCQPLPARPSCLQWAPPSSWWGFHVHRKCFWFWRTWYPCLGILGQARVQMSPNESKWVQILMARQRQPNPLNAKLQVFGAAWRLGCPKSDPQKLSETLICRKCLGLKKKRTTRCNQFFLLRMRRVLLDAISLVQRMPQDAARRYKKGVRCKLNVI